MKMLSFCLPPLLCALLRLHFACTDLPNITLVFDSTTHSDSLRNCSCATEVRHCEETLANLLCNCGTVPRSSLTARGPRWDNRRTDGTLSVWVHNSWIRMELLNGSHVLDLHLSLCAPAALLGPAQYLTLVGLKRIQLYTLGKEALHRDQTMNIIPGVGLNVWDSGLSIALLDVGSMSGALRLKAYSVVGPSLRPHPPSHFYPGLFLSVTFPHLEQQNKQKTI
uniref:Uncharacterized protein n=1 Tax=Astyanax mexicanus TaxID=7994 RepID=A0A8B9J9K7_ASTMX